MIWSSSEEHVESINVLEMSAKVLRQIGSFILNAVDLLCGRVNKLQDVDFPIAPWIQLKVFVSQKLSLGRW